MEPPSAALDSFSRPAAAWSARNFCAPFGAPPSSMAIHYHHAEANSERFVKRGYALAFGSFAL
jgi:hypothetical protein